MKRGTPLGRTAALVVLGLAAAALYAGVIAPLTTLYEMRNAQLAELSIRWSQLRQEATLRPEIEARLAALTTPERTPFWPGPSGDATSSAMAARVQALFEAAGSAPTAISVSPGRSDGPLQRLDVTAAFKGGIDDLQGVLAAVKDVQPALFIERVAVRASQDAAPLGDLTIEIGLYGFAGPPGGPAGPS